MNDESSDLESKFRFHLPFLCLQKLFSVVLHLSINFLYSQKINQIITELLFADITQLLIICNQLLL